MDILVNVVNQKLKIATNLKSLVAGTQKFVRFVFNLTGDWDNLMTFAQFSQNGVSYNQYLDENNSAYLPAEIGVGTCTLMLYGSNEYTIATTNYLTLTIDKNILVFDTQSTEMSESLYNQLVSRFQDLNLKVTNLENDKVIADLIQDAAENKIQTLLSNGSLANMTIENGSISSSKLDDNLKNTLIKLDEFASSMLSKLVIGGAI